jgi:hypothetical protein
VSPVRYEIGFYIPKDGSLPSRRRENLGSYIPDPCLPLLSYFDRQNGSNMLLQNSG